MNIVTEKQSADNAQAYQANSSTVTLVNFSGIKGKFPKDGLDIYLKIVCGSNVVKTSTITKSKKDVEWKDSPKIYVNARQYRLTLIAFEQKSLKDEIIGVGEIFLEELKGVNSTVKLLNRTAQ